jgi:Ca2+-binding RTX toxin-like protein
MATVLFSGIPAGTTLSFDPASDTLSFDDASISAASLALTYASNLSSVGITAGGKSFALPAAMSLGSLAGSNFSFADGSVLLIGDNSPGTNDNQANTLTGTGYDDQLLGLGGNDTLIGAGGNDLLNGGSGADRLKGGLGADTYLVDDVGDVVDETPSLDALRMSTDADGAQVSGGSFFRVRLSVDGRYAVFESTVANLVPGDTAVRDVFVKDLQSGAIQRVTANGVTLALGDSTSNASFSPDGRYVLFHTSAKMLDTDTNGAIDVFLKDLVSGTIERLSTSSAGLQVNGNSLNARFSADGGSVVFQSAATNLVSGDNNAGTDIFIKSLQSGVVQRVSTNSSNAQTNAGAGSIDAQLSSDGRYVVFTSSANNLVADDTNGRLDIFVKDLQTAEVRMVSTDAAGTPGNFNSHNAQFSADGRYVVFSSDASNLVSGDTNAAIDIFVKDLQTGAIQRVSTDAAGNQGNSLSTFASFSPDGRYVLFQSSASNLVSNDTNGAYDIFVKDLHTGAIRIVGGDAAGFSNNGGDYNAQFSADGRYVVFESDASNLLAGDSNGTRDVFRVTHPFYNEAAIDTVRSVISYAMPAGVENLVLRGTAAIDGTGNELDNRITGNTGNNTLHGGGGADTLIGGGGNDSMAGGLGNDTYYVEQAADIVSESPAAGSDTVYSYLTHSAGQSYTLPVHVENARIMATDASSITGNSRSNLIDAGQGNNTISGGAGAEIDTVSYLYGLVAGATSGVNANLETGSVSGSSGSDTLVNIENLRGSNLSDALIGNAGSNLIRGSGGADTLSGGAGADTLSGGAGNDVFDFNNLTDSGITSDTWDVITDFVRGKDRIDLSTLDANTATLANNAFSGTLIAADVAFSAAGQLKLVSGVLYGNTDADTDAEFAIALTGITVLSASDFIL